MLKKIKFVVLHHSWSPDRQTLDFPGIVRHHVMIQGWRDVGYTEIIEEYKNKIVSLSGRPIYLSGAHAKGFNSNSYSFCFIGNYDKEKPSHKMWVKGLERVKVACLTHNVPVKNVIGHAETFVLLGKARTLADAQKKYKTCPGRKFDLDKFRQGLANIL